MNIVILGAGVAGVSSAYFLRKLGHRVTVIDRQPAVGQSRPALVGRALAAAPATGAGGRALGGGGRLLALVLGPVPALPPGPLPAEPR